MRFFQVIAMPPHLAQLASFAAAAFAIGVATGQPAFAQCGSPPDPRSNSAGYASWCSCMGGSYNYQTTACVGARGPGGSSKSSSSSGGGWACRAEARGGAFGFGRDYATEAEAREVALSYCRRNAGGQACSVTFCGRGAGEAVARPAGAGPRQSAAAPAQTWKTGGAWACRAEASGGASGWVKDGATEADARQGALAHCKQYSKGRACSVKFCGLGLGAAVEKPGAAADRPASNEPSQQQTRLTGPYTCEECHRKLRADVDKAWASSRTVSYVPQALAGYSNCKLKATSACFMGDIFARTLRNACASFTVEKDHRACIGRIIGRIQ